METVCTPLTAETVSEYVPAGVEAGAGPVTGVGPPPPPPPQLIVPKTAISTNNESALFLPPHLLKARGKQRVQAKIAATRLLSRCADVVAEVLTTTLTLALA